MLLSASHQTWVNVSKIFPFEDGEYIDLDVIVSRESFEQSVAKHLDKIIPVVEKAIKDSGLTKAEMHDIVLVGGSTRVPKVREILSEFFDNR